MTHEDSDPRPKLVTSLQSYDRTQVTRDAIRESLSASLSLPVSTTFMAGSIRWNEPEFVSAGRESRIGKGYREGSFLVRFEPARRDCNGGQRAFSESDGDAACRSPVRSLKLASRDRDELAARCAQLNGNDVAVH